MFHPKIYLFSNSIVDWECLVGSANLTKSACTENTEIIAHISSSDEGSKKALKKIQAQIKTYWNESESMSNEDYNHYCNVWKSNQKRLKTLSGSYSKKKNEKPILKSEIYSMDWSSYVNKVKNDRHHSLNKRLDLLERVQNIFKDYSKFNQIPLDLRKGIAGFASEDEIPWGWFGSMRGAGKFKNRINKNDINISRALDRISLSGEITKKDFDRYIEKFVAAFPDGGDGIAIASRLLAMKRPDVFVCLDAQNLEGITAEFGMIRTGMTYERYWDEIIVPIFDSVWWNQPKPKKGTEARIWMGRAAMLDAIFYEPKQA